MQLYHYQLHLHLLPSKLNPNSLVSSVCIFFSFVCNTHLNTHWLSYLHLLINRSLKWGVQLYLFLSLSASGSHPGISYHSIPLLFLSPSKVVLLSSPFAPPERSGGPSHSQASPFPRLQSFPSLNRSLLSPNPSRYLINQFTGRKDIYRLMIYTLTQLELSTDEKYPLMEGYLLKR